MTAATSPSSPRRKAKRDRALTRQRFLADRGGAFDRSALDEALARVGGHGPLTAPPAGDVRRWVPIGPSIMRRGQAVGRPRVSGRIRDLAVSADGRRAYAASAMGGVWYTGDGGTSWDPVGGWAERQARAGGSNNAQSCGCILVAFRDDDRANDLVLVGTGEAVPSLQPAGEGSFGGLGVLAAVGPAARAPIDNPWEAEAGQALMEGLGTFRLVRHPGATPGSTSGAAQDRVLVATSAGLFLGTRIHVAAPPAHDEFTWAKLPGIDLLAPPPAPPAPQVTRAVTDVLWLPRTGSADGRIVVAIDAMGVAVSDDAGATFTWLAGCNQPVSGVAIQGFSSLANVDGTSRVYILSALPPPPAGPPPAPAPPPDTPALFEVADMTPAAPAAPQAVQVGGVPPLLWDGQRDYDQAIAVDSVGGAFRVYLGGSVFDVAAFGHRDFAASLWCFDVGPGPTLVAAPGISRRGAPAPPPPPAPPAAAGDGADVPGLIGNTVHADVHAIRFAGTPANRQVWVGCDGGVYVSTQGGRINTFAARATGLAALQAGFVAPHPTSSHFVAAGFQDNGTGVRSGDTLWEEVFLGDGGGLVFHPHLSHYIVAQFITASWSSVPPTGFVSPTSRLPGGGAAVGDREDSQRVSSFYSGASVVAPSPTTARIALGTNRVWLTDNLGASATNRWRVLPYPNGGLSDPRQNGNDPAARQTDGVPAGNTAAGNLGPIVPNATVGPRGPLRSVVTVRWASATELLALFQRGCVRWVENPAGQWTATVLFTGTAFAAATVLTDVFPIPGTRDFYLTTTGSPANAAVDTCFLWDDATSALIATGLRRVLDPPPPPPGVVGPLDPAYSVVVDPAAPTDVYVGTVTGVWRGVRAAGTTNIAWQNPPLVNGLPQAAVQDLSIWTDPTGAAGSPRLLRAAVQARGVWEVDLAAGAEVVRTYLRVHPRDDRRRLPTPMANPRRGPTAAAERVFESPDVVVRPRANAGIAPRWLFGSGQINEMNVPAYQLWTFQTAFRWRYPSVVADGMWTDAFGDLVELHRASTGLSLGRFIDRALWNAVVLGTRLDANGAFATATAADPLAVYRPAWQSPTALQALATEVDLLETVQPRSVTAGVWGVFKERCTVEVLLHHRDTRQVPPGQSFALLLWRSAASSSALLATPATGIVDFARNAAGGNPFAVPAGWNNATPTPADARNPLGVPLDARLPRAVPVDVDLTGVPVNHRVLFLAIAGSQPDRCGAAPVGLPASPTVRDLVTRWPYAALRMVQVSARP